MHSSKLTSKSQITIPKAVRETLSLHPGDRIRFLLQHDGTVTVEAESVDLRTLRGVFNAERRHVTIEQMGDAIRRGATGGSDP